MADPALARLADTLFWVGLVTFGVAMAAYLATASARARGVRAIPTIVAWAGCAATAGSALARGLAADRVPWGNMFEYSTMVGLLIVAVYLVVVEARMGLRQLGGLALGAGFLALVAARFTYVPAGPLQPALDSNWLKVHVLAAITASSLFGLSFIFTVLSLLKARAERRAARVSYGGSTVGAAYVEVEEGLPEDLVTEEPEARMGRMMARLPSSSTFDALAFRTIQVAFPIWTFAVMAGAVWAHEAWGRYWAWDPKETWAFVTWVVYAGYLHARSTAGWRGTRAAILSCVGFGCVLFTYFAVNLVISGLHSYKNG